MASLGSPRVAPRCRLHDPVPTAKHAALNDPEHSLPVPFSVLSPDGPLLSPGVCARQEEQGRRGSGTREGARLRRGGSVFTNHISSLCAGSEQAVA